MAKTNKGGAQASPADEFLADKTDELSGVSDIMDAPLNDSDEVPEAGPKTHTTQPQPKKPFEFHRNYKNAEKPQIPVLGGSRRFGILRRPASLPLSDQMLPPITRKKVATYEVLNYERKDPLIREGDGAIPPVPIVIPGTYTIYDPYEPDLANTHKVMQNITGQERVSFKNPATGKNEFIMQPKIEDVILEQGFLQVNIETNYVMHAFMELHPLNLSNKWRSNDVMPAFKRADMQYRVTALQTFDLDIAFEAEQYVIKMDKEEIINLASSLNPPIATIGRQIAEIRFDMRIRARQEPRTILFERGDQKATIRLNVLDALTMTILEYVPDLKGFIYASSPRTPFFVVPVGNDPQEALARYFDSEEGAEEYQATLDLLSFWK